jgi:hypothetical protein
MLRAAACSRASVRGLRLLCQETQHGRHLRRRATVSKLPGNVITPAVSLHALQFVGY